MSYLIRRKTALAPILEKQKSIEEVTKVIKAKREQEEVLLEKVASELRAQSQELAQVTQDLDSLDESALELAGIYSDFIRSIDQSIYEAEEILNTSIEIIQKANLQISAKGDELNELQIQYKSIKDDIAEKQKKLSEREKSLGIYKDRLYQKAHELGIHIPIRL